MEAEVEVGEVMGGWRGVHGAVGGQGVELAVAGVTEEPSSPAAVMERVPTWTERSVV